MDIHKPKPWHGAREFLKEYVIIVVGVLTALAGEQTVETLRWRADVDEARKALVEEVSANAVLSEQGVEESRCLLIRLGEFKAWANGGPRPGLPLDAVRFSSPNSTVWSATQSAQTIGHMPLKERLGFARFYAAVANQQTVFQSLRAAWVELSRDSDVGQLSPDEARRLRGDVTATSIWSNVRGITASDLVKEAQGLGIRPPPIPPGDQRRLARLCGSIGGGS